MEMAGRWLIHEIPHIRMSPQWSSDYFRDAAGDATRQSRGLVGHVPIVAILLMAQGGLELAFGLLCLGYCALVFVLPPEVMGGIDAGVMFVLMGVFAVSGLACGGLRIMAGLSNWSYRRRMLGITALGVGLASMFNCYCAPTAIALAIYGLIVYVNESVVAAFELGTQGRSKAEIQAAFPADM
jgi:hypothetical protein